MDKSSEIGKFGANLRNRKYGDEEIEEVFLSPNQCFSLFPFISRYELLFKKKQNSLSFLIIITINESRLDCKMKAFWKTL